jgi:hypothetical protein
MRVRKENNGSLPLSWRRAVFVCPESYTPKSRI